MEKNDQFVMIIGHRPDLLSEGIYQHYSKIGSIKARVLPR